MLDKWNEMLSLKLYVSYRSVLDSCYSVASANKQYSRCAKIQDLIIEDINS